MNIKTKFRKACTLAVTLLMLLFIITGCGNSSGSSGHSNAGSSNNGKLMKLQFGTSPWPTNMFAYLANDLGIFKKHGLDVQLNNFSSYSSSVQAFLAGHLDIITTPSSDAITPYSQGAKFSVIMLTDKSLGSDGLVVNKNIKSIQDLKGKTIATELYTVDHMYLLSLLDKAGISPDQVKVVNMAIADSGAAFMAGKVDAASIWEPYLSKALTSNNAKLLYSSKSNPDLITDSIIASQASMQNNPKAVQAFVDSWYEAVDYWKKNKAKANNIMAKHLEVSDKEFTDMMNKLSIADAKDALKSFDSSNDTSFVVVNQNIAKFLNKLKVINNVPDVSKMLNTTYLKNSSLIKN